MFSTGHITDEQLHAMWSACSEVSNELAARDACRKLSERLSAIIAAPTMVYSREVSPWKLLGISSAATAPTEAAPLAARQLDRLAPALVPYYQVLRGDEGTRWTPVLLEESFPSQAMLLLPGDWTTGSLGAWLPRFARTASMALRLAAVRCAARANEGVAASAYDFARRLGQLSGERELYQFIVDATARAANARLAGLAVYQPKEATIKVAATYGYPSEIVGHVRIMPGSGIIGGVFASKKPLLVRDTTRVPGLMPRRPRYQTASFMALPVVVGNEALGVVTLADHAEGRPFTRDDLAALRILTIVSGLGMVREQLARRTDALAHAAAVDPVTGMFNRRYLETRLEAEVERSRRSATPLSLLMLDVDGFKGVNDKFGHQRGDAVLRKVAEIVRRSVRASDVSTRYGGDEFAIIIPEHAASAPQTAERIRSRVEAFPWATLGVPQHLHVTLSVGVALGEIGEGAETLIGRADHNLYCAKSHGRNRVYPAGE